MEIFRRGRFVEQVFSPNKLGVTVNLAPSLRFEIEKRGADEDAVLALVTPLRFFVQPRDGINLQQIVEIYDNLPVEDSAKQSARRAVDSVNNYLDSPLGFSFNGKEFSNRQVFETFMYGGLAHANDDKKLQYEEWMQGPFASVFQFFFENIAANIVQKIVSFYTMNERTIGLLG